MTTCIVCGGEVSEFVVKNGRVTKQRRRDMRFCSWDCFCKRESWTEPTEQRFWKKVNKDGPIHPVYGQCWLWTGWKNPKGYGGGFSINRVELKAHRASWLIHFGVIPEECVLHRCDTPACVNPSHLFLGTVPENNADMVAKSRQARGEMKTTIAILREEDVRAIRLRYIPRHRIHGASAIAREYGMDPRSICAVVRRENWRHIQ